jgi:hypothetical protein
MKKARRIAEPSAASLREMPELDFTKVKLRRNPYAARIAAEGRFHIAPGRPRKGTETGPTVPRSIRFPAPVWRQIEKRAKAQGITLHAALRAAVIAWMRQENMAR